MDERNSVMGPLFCRNSLFMSTLIIGIFQIIYIIINFSSSVTKAAWISSYFLIYHKNVTIDVTLDALATVLWSIGTVGLFLGLYRKKSYLFLPNMVVQSLQLFASFCNIALMIYFFAIYPREKPLIKTIEQYTTERRITFSVYGIKLFMNCVIACFCIICFRLIFIAYCEPKSLTYQKNKLFPEKHQRREAEKALWVR